MRRVLILALAFVPMAIHAQRMADPQAPAPATFAEDPQATQPAPEQDPGRDVSDDPTSLTGRGGPALRSNRTFQGAIGTPIYTPIGTSIGTRMGVPH